MRIHTTKPVAGVSQDHYVGEVSINTSAIGELAANGATTGWALWVQCNDVVQAISYRTDPHIPPGNNEFIGASVILSLQRAADDTDTASRVIRRIQSLARGSNVTRPFRLQVLMR